ncbi:DNA-processing protein DprA [Microbacterium sp. W1N]|uniref:DNA-processing protein DprA n=1 Tax=Microbacterium festucae TaxID=2977531 RepID=UPI0021C175CA|nr:DNA-processing protein DprA [Microbacterium festucae]MCT9820305.1 DNA-processing protein DprA [Microbacterium festucae]
MSPAPAAPSADAEARAHLSVLGEPGDGALGAMVGALGAPRALELALGSAPLPSEAHAAGLDGAALADGRRRWQPRRGDLGAALADAARVGAALVTPDHPHWPRRVDDLGPHAPLCLWVRGDTAALVAPAAVAVVGARAATGYGEHVAGELAAALAAAGITVVSGAAYGIDGAAHHATLGSGGSTVAFLAGGVDRAYPAGHQELLRRICAHGAVVSEVPCGSAPTKWRFLARNRVIAAASDATVVVEAGWRSGSLNTASHAAALGRPLGAVPGPITSSASAGCHRLLRTHDAVCITGADDVLELIGESTATAAVPAGPEPGGDQTRVRDALSVRTARSVDEIARRSGLSAGAVQSVLGLLALTGAARRADAGWTAVSAAG